VRECNVRFLILSHLLLQRPLLLILCLLDLPPLHQYSLPLSLCVCGIVWAETGVLESEQIPTSCNLFHNQDLYSALPLPSCQIVISAQSIYVSSRLLLFRSCYPVVHVLYMCFLEQGDLAGAARFQSFTA
jgi:hypothetical protein